MPLLMHKTGPDASNVRWGLGILLILVTIIVACFIIGSVMDIQDFYILGGIFSFFTLITFICLFSTMLRPTYRVSRQVSSTERQVSETEKDRMGNVGFVSSTTDLRSKDSKITISPFGSMAGERTDNVLIDVKSRIGSANSLKPTRNVRFTWFFLTKF